jgi:DNA-binding NarL/FixJ family response regulator
MQEKSDSPRIRIAIVEDDVKFRQYLVETIEKSPDMRLVSETSTRAKALTEMSEIEPDVLLVDLGLPDGSGIDVIRNTHQKWPNCSIMVCTAFGDELHVMQSLEAGAAGYLLKDSGPQSIQAEIRSLHAGGSPISPLIARQILTRFRQTEQSSEKGSVGSDTKARASLSAREQQVLEYITKGFTTDEIAKLLIVSKHTIQTFVRRIYSKLEVSSKTEAIYEARKQGLLHD